MIQLPDKKEMFGVISSAEFKRQERQESQSFAAKIEIQNFC